MRPGRAIVVVAACAVLAALFAGCASTAAEIDWRGHKIDEAVARYGPPSQVSASETGTVYVWRMKHERQGMGGFPGATREIRTTIRMMTVNADGVVTSSTLTDQ